MKKKNTKKRGKVKPRAKKVPQWRVDHDTIVNAERARGDRIAQSIWRMNQRLESLAESVATVREDMRGLRTDLLIGVGQLGSIRLTALDSRKARP